MSVQRLQRAIDALPRSGVGLDAVQRLEVATGARVGAGEGALLRELLTDRYDRFSPSGLNALERLVNTGSTARPTTSRLSVVERYLTNLPEQSALAWISKEHGFIAVDDESSVLWHLPFPDGTALQIRPRILRHGDGELRGLEGATYDPETRSLLVVSEETGFVHEMALRVVAGALSLKSPRLVGRLPKLGRHANKGYEGLTVLPASKAPDGRARIVAVHEGLPRRIGIHDRTTLRAEAEVVLPAELQRRLKDLSGCAVDPATGHLLLLSDEARTLAETRLVPVRAGIDPAAPISDWRLTLLGFSVLPPSLTKNRLQPEGLSVDDKGDVWVLSEGDQSLLHLDRSSTAQ
ncbi:MAG: SdiA-regulated domain-containing protein [Deltaproteobacteria bacterium]|nr:SdiA-regulated domain-containing protein [Deltaproteobacteria bacterium]